MVITRPLGAAKPQKTLFSCTALPANKAGILKKDEFGYFEIPIGGLNCFNSAGHWYTADQTAELFAKSSHLNRRIEDGRLFAEAGHPKRLPGQSEDDYIQRILTIEESMVAGHWASIRLDYDSIKDERGRPVVAMIGKVKGEGKFGPALESSLLNPKINTAFSIRSFTEDSFVAGVRNRIIRQIITWDWVIEPGISFAGKYNSPSLEGRRLAVDLESAEMTREVIQRAMRKPVLAGMESCRLMGVELFQQLGWNMDVGDLPSYAKW